MKYKKALVTGGAGFIGSHLVNKLLSEGLQVVVLDDLSVGKKTNLTQEAEFIYGDIRDQSVISYILNNFEIDVVFHQAARVTIRGSTDEFLEDADINLKGTLTLLNALRDSTVKKLLFASSMAVYSDSSEPIPINEDYSKHPISPYGIAKLSCEHYCRLICAMNSIDCVILRYFNTYGPRQTLTPYVGVMTIFINKLINNQPPIIFGDGKQQRDFVHVDDIVQGNILAMNTDIRSGTFNIGTGQGTSVNQIAEMLINRLMPKINPKHTTALKEETRNSIADISHAKRNLGFRPMNAQLKPDDVIDFWTKQN